MCLVALLAGCNDKNEQADSLGYAPDTIKLSTEELLFDNTTSVQEVMTEGDQVDNGRGCLRGWQAHRRR